MDNHKMGIKENSIKHKYMNNIHIDKNIEMLNAKEIKLFKPAGFRRTHVYLLRVWKINI